MPTILSLAQQWYTGTLTADEALHAMAQCDTDNWTVTDTISAYFGGCLTGGEAINRIACEVL